MGSNPAGWVSGTELGTESLRQRDGDNLEASPGTVWPATVIVLSIGVVFIRREAHQSATVASRGAPGRSLPRSL
jgi:hypothetical protein